MEIQYISLGVAETIFFLVTIFENYKFYLFIKIFI